MSEKFKRLLWTGMFIVLGTLAGYLYYHFYGCTSGCLISSSPIRSMVYAAVIAGLLSVVFRRESGREEQ